MASATFLFTCFSSRNLIFSSRCLIMMTLSSIIVFLSFIVSFNLAMTISIWPLFTSLFTTQHSIRFPIRNLKPFLFP
uniref:Putative secreted protein n=1 Tax=Xenopsylla cheopis TaxID=163159 RepID=A0A6M2DGJ5_XENCH